MKLPASAAAISVVAAIVGLASTANAATITDGSFETALVSSNGYYTDLGVGSTVIPGWSVVTGTVDYITNGPTYWKAEDGTDALDMAGSGPGSIAQTIATTAGKTYGVSFYMAANPDDNSHGYSEKELSVNASGSATKVFSFNDPQATYQDLGWTKMTYEFTAVSSSTVLTFADIDPSVNTPGSLYYGTPGSPYGAALDNVSISAVPEPSVWIMMLGGIGIAGGLLRVARARRREKQFMSVATA